MKQNQKLKGLVCKSRIAPTPSGFLHTGNLFNFLLTEKLTLQSGGSLRLRIDDLDEERLRLPYLNNIFDTLHWLGIAWQEGPADSNDHLQRYTQKLRFQRYNRALQALAQTGKVFACTCSRKQIRDTADERGQYNGACLRKGLPLNTAGATWRVETPPDCTITFEDVLLGKTRVTLHQEMRHFVVRRTNGLPSYQIASLCDDLDYGINLIVRGNDLLHSTAAQLYLAGLLGETGFLSTRFYHHPLLSGGDNAKLSKSAGSLSQPLMQTGVSAQKVKQDFSDWLRSSGIIIKPIQEL